MLTLLRQCECFTTQFGRPLNRKISETDKGRDQVAPL